MMILHKKMIENLKKDNLLIIAIDDAFGDEENVAVEERVFVTDSMGEIWKHISNVLPKYRLWRTVKQLEEEFKEMEPGKSSLYYYNEIIAVVVKDAHKFLQIHRIFSDGTTKPLFTIGKPKIIYENVQANRTVH